MIEASDEQDVLLFAPVTTTESTLVVKLHAWNSTVATTRERLRGVPVE